MSAPQHNQSDCADPDCTWLPCVVPRAAKRALDVVNSKLWLQAVVTKDGNEVKCWTPDANGDGVSKTYLNAGECVELATAFTTLASVLERGTQHKPVGGDRDA